jgi:hypothetical protein
MNKLILAIAFAGLVLTGCNKGNGDSNETNSSADANSTFEKKGFLTTKWCAEQGMFADCRMESIVCGEGECNQKWEFGDKEKMELVLLTHDELKYYNIDTSKIDLSKAIEEGINKNEVTIKGDFDEGANTIVATSFEAPAAGGKSFFKGCL